MTEYSTVIAYISLIIAGFSGLIILIQNIMYDFAMGDALGVALKIIFSEILIFFYGAIPFISWFIFLFLIGLPFYGLYKLFTK